MAVNVPPPLPPDEPIDSPSGRQWLYLLWKRQTSTGQVTYNNLVFPTKTITTNTTQGNTDFLVEANASGGALTYTLLSATSGLQVNVKKTDSTANAVTIAASGGQLIDGQASVSIVVQYDSIWLFANGSGWRII